MHISRSSSRRFARSVASGATARECPLHGQRFALLNRYPITVHLMAIFSPPLHYGRAGRARQEPSSWSAFSVASETRTKTPKDVFCVYVDVFFFSVFALCFGYTASCRGQVSSKWWEKDTPGFILIPFFSSLEEHKIEEEDMAGARNSAGCTILRFAVLCQDGFPHRFFHPQNHSHRRAENDERDRFGLYRLIKYLHLSECMFLSAQRGWWALCGGGGKERTATQRKAKPPPPIPWVTRLIASSVCYHAQGVLSCHVRPVVAPRIDDGYWFSSLFYVFLSAGLLVWVCVCALFSSLERRKRRMTTLFAVFDWYPFRSPTHR